MVREGAKKVQSQGGGSQESCRFALERSPAPRFPAPDPVALSDGIHLTTARAARTHANNTRVGFGGGQAPGSPQSTADPAALVGGKSEAPNVSAVRDPTCLTRA